MRLTVVIPARNEEHYLPLLLRALAAQTRLPDEVIVVDNGSTDRTAEVARAFAGLPGGVRVVACVRPGVAHARQAGLEAATGDWVVSTDADSVPGAEWLYLLERAMRGGVSGLYGPLRLQPLPQKVNRAMSHLSERFYRLFLAGCALAGRPNTAGANMAFRRADALALGGYPHVEAREDVLLGLALRQRGRVRYVRGALVHTSSRRVSGAGGWRRFLLLHLRNLAGQTSGYFSAAHPPAPHSPPVAHPPVPHSHVPHSPVPSPQPYLSRRGREGRGRG